MHSLTTGPEAVIDPGRNVGWWSQHEQGHSAKGKVDDDDEEDDSDDSDDDDEEDDSDDDDLDADLTEDELKAELKKTREQLNRSTSSNAAKRKRIKAREAELIEARKHKAPVKPKGKVDEDDAPDLDAVRESVRAEVKAEADTRIKKAEARGALRAAGVSAERVAKAVGLITLDDVDVDDEGEVEGLDDAIDALRKEWPELFPKGSPRQRARVGGDKDSDGKMTRSRKPMTVTEMQVAAALGKPIRR